MKGKLFPQIYDIRTLWQAWNRIKRKGSTGGIDKVSVEIFERKLEYNLKEISQSLQRETYVPEPTKRVYILKNNSHEKRKISLPTIKDKVVQEATRSTVEPLFNSTFLDSSYAYRPGKGPQKAIRKVEHYLEQGRIWIATFDIDNFFDSINHSLLIRFVSNKIWEKEVLRLIELWLKMGIIERDKWVDVEIGVPQGGIISPLLSNIYLHPFDSEMKKRNYALVRYADDFILLEKTRGDAINALKDTETFLKRELSLTLNQDSKSIRSI